MGGGIQSDISTVVTYHVLERFVRTGGCLAFLITGTVFKNESSQGFRRWRLPSDDGVDELIEVELVEDYKEIRPFEGGGANWPALLLARKNGKKTEYPVTYRVYHKPDKKNDEVGCILAASEDLCAVPIPGTSDGPWLVGQREQIEVWKKLFDANAADKHYAARKGVTTDANGIYFVTAETTGKAGLLRVSNDPSNGRRSLARITADVEEVYVYPLLRGRDVNRFKGSPKESGYVIVPQTGMFGDEQLPVKAPMLFQFLANFKDILASRSSYRRFQQGKPFWSIWTTGDYTFAPFKVVWKEMSGNNFVVAYVGSSSMPGARSKLIVPDRKVYFIPSQTEEEAAYLTAFLNAQIVSSTISAYASALSLGTSVVDYLKIPKYNSRNSSMRELSKMGMKFSAGVEPSQKDEIRMNKLVEKIVG